MIAYWLTFTDGSQACCEGQNEFDAKRIAEHFTKKKVAGGDYNDIAAMRLPYPANPCIWQLDHPVTGKCPLFCGSPVGCAGHGACPRDYACSN